jgi:hypothetical protein
MYLCSICGCHSNGYGECRLLGCGPLGSSNNVLEERIGPIFRVEKHEILATAKGFLCRSWNQPRDLWICCQEL